ncbi:MAG: hypothetical protein SF053_13690 [Bacteroidia bacterium]|nr:hypothetical protein [Bacteroidia bacterium]
MFFWKKFVAASAALILLLKPLQVAQACVWDPDWNFYGYSFFDPGVLEQPDMKPFFLSFNQFYGGEWMYDTLKTADNITEWRTYCQQKATPADIQALVYEATVEDLKPARLWVSGKSATPPPALGTNTMLKVFQQQKNLAALTYLDFAKRCEPHATYDPYAWEQPERDVEAMRTLIKEGELKYKASTDAFLKLRYAYQIVRLAQYAGLSDACIDFFDRLVTPLNNQSLLYYWALSHKAGALMAKGDLAQADYLFSRVFEQCPSRRIPAWLSFQVDSDETWTEVLSHCKTPDEKATVFLIRGINLYSHALEEATEIYRINPTSRAIELLIAREINKVEYDLMGTSFDFSFPIKQEYDGVSTEEAKAYLADIRAFVQQHNREQPTVRPVFWKMAEGHLAFLSGDFAQAENILRSIQAPDARTRQQVALLRWVVSLSRLDKPTFESEEALYQQFSQFAFEPDEHDLQLKAERYLLNVMAARYEAAGQMAQAYLCRHERWEFLSYPDVETADLLLKWLQTLRNRKPSGMESFLAQRLDEHPLEFVTEVRATLHLRAGEWEQAISLYRSIPEDIRRSLPYFNLPLDPFQGFNQDCINCFDSETPEVVTNRLAMAETILALEAEARTNPAKATANYLKLGHATYNMSYFGPAWMAAAYARSSSSLWYLQGEAEEYEGAQEWRQKQLNGMFTNMARPEAYYRKALAATKDPELAAQATFMAAKCRQNQFYLDGYADFDGYGDMDFETFLKTKKPYRKDLDALITKYKNTRYYQQVLRECTYLQAYESFNY